MEIINKVAKCLIRAILFVLHCTMIPFTWFRSLKKTQRCPPIANKLLMMPATQLAAKIRSKELTSEEIVKAYINRCKEVNPVLNAVVQNRYDAALSEACEVDKFLKSGIKTAQELAFDTPFLGIPMTVKESIAVAGMSHTAGRKMKNPQIAQNDADAVERMKKAGAIPLLVSNTPEMCMCWETYNGATGTTWNPYDTRRTPGGSSGGEAALLGAGASLISLSSDIGGSARLPAMFCGVFGHKPTPEWVSNKGHLPDCDDVAWPNFFTIGPMVRYAEDLNIMLKAIVQSEAAVGQLDEEVRSSNIKFYYLEDYKSSVTSCIDKEMTNGIHKFIQYLDNTQGIKVQKAEIPDLKYAFETATMMLLRLDGVDTIFKKDDDPHDWNSVSWEVLKYISFISPHIFTSVAYGVVKKFADKLPEGVYKWIREKNNTIKRQFQELLGDNGVIICPTFPNAAHFPYEIYPKICNVTYMMIFNSIGLPVTQCPIGLNKDGLPIGFQVVGNVGSDHLTIAVAREVEKAFGGWQEPPSNRIMV